MTQVAEGSSDAAELAVAAAAQGIRGRRPMAELVEKNMAEIEKALPPGVMDPERFVRIILTEFRKTPKLLTCTPTSFLGALFQTAQLGLEPGGQLGHAYLIPYDTRDKSTKEPITECQLQVGYKGYVELAGRRGIMLRAREVKENDEFDFDLGSHEYLHHKWTMGQPRGEVIGFYGKVVMPDGNVSFHVMEIPEINARRDRSSAVRSGRKTPWDSDYDAMARKTVIRAMVPQIALAPDLQIALRADEAVINRSDKGDLSYLYRDAIDVPTEAGGAAEDFAVEPGPDAPVPPVDLDGIPEITRAVLEDHLDDELKAQAKAYVEAYMDEHPQAVDEQVAHALELWLNEESASEPSEAAGAEQGSVRSDTPGEPSEAQSGGTSDILVATQRAVDTWPIDTVKRILGEWSESKAGAEKVLRLRLSTRLALERQRGNQAAIDLF